MCTLKRSSIAAVRHAKTLPSNNIKMIQKAFVPVTTVHTVYKKLLAPSLASSAGAVTLLANESVCSQRTQHQLRI